MLNKARSIIIFTLLLSLLSVSLVFAQGKELETGYPEIGGLKPETLKFPLAEYFKYIFSFSIWIAGIIALIGLLIGGIRYLTSTGKPEDLEKAKKQVLAAFFGIIILLASYLILVTINPELVILKLSELRKIVFSPLDLPSLSPKIPELLTKVREIADNVKIVSTSIEDAAQRIQDLTNQCDCSYTQPLCYCTGGEAGDRCEPRQCYAGPGSDPCSGFREIKENQKRIIAWQDEILYYRNRALAEEEDLLLQVNQLTEKINYYQEKLKIETDEKVIEYFKEQIATSEKEKQLRQSLATKLRELADLAEEIDPFISKIAALPDKCLYDEGVYGVNNKCNAHCKGGCHDIKQGCEPVNCDGGNPCPVGEINDQLLLIQGLDSSISNKCDEILNVIDEIIEFKTIYI